MCVCVCVCVCVWPCVYVGVCVGVWMHNPTNDIIGSILHKLDLIYVIIIDLHRLVWHLNYFMNQAAVIHNKYIWLISLLNGTSNFVGY